jgi:uncharacterized membrane protein (UPF0127 family)
MNWAEGFEFRRRFPADGHSMLWDFNTGTAFKIKAKEVKVTHIDGITPCKSARIFNDGEMLYIFIEAPVYIYYNKAGEKR